MSAGRFSPRGSKTREQFERDDVTGRRHDHSDYWAPTSPHAGRRRRGGLPSQTGNPAFGWWKGDDEPHRRLNWSFYRNGGDRRPAWEDMILSRIDAERAVARLKESMQHDSEREDREPAETPEAQELRAIRLRGGQAGVAAAEALQARHARRTRGGQVRSWHARRTAEGYPEGFEPEETEG